MRHESARSMQLHVTEVPREARERHAGGWHDTAVKPAVQSQASGGSETAAKLEEHETRTG